MNYDDQNDQNNQGNQNDQNSQGDQNNQNNQEQPQNEANNLKITESSKPSDYSITQPAQENISPYGSNMQNQWNYEAYQNAINTKKKKKNKGLMAFVISICSIFSIALLGLAVYGVYNLATNSGSPLLGLTNTSSSTGQKTNNNGPTLNIANQPQSSAAKAASGVLTIQQVAQNVRPSVVGIVSYSKQQMGELGEGSGIIMSADGYIVTNNHVVSGADSVQVVLSDNTKYPATIIGSDSRSDLAVIKIDAKNLKFATFGNSAQLLVGDSVLAIGNPGGLEFANSVTEGIVSALNRTVNNVTYIQTDAAINPGNSGGALVNMFGQVVGINAAKISDVSYEGIGFSIPVNLAKPIIDDLIKFRYVQNRVKLGISCGVFDQTQANLYGAPTGLLISTIDPTSDAAKVGLQQNDIITKVNGKAVSITDDLLKEENNFKAGQSLTLTIFRLQSGTSKTFEVSVKLMEDRGTTTTASQAPQTTQNPNDFFNAP
jgi:serine protease Do